MAVFIDQCHLSNGLVIFSDSRTPLHELFKEVYRTNAYTQPDIPQIVEDGVVVDLGANIGMFSLFAAKLSPRVQVHAFEPAPGTFALLKKNVLANNLSNVQCHECAVSSKTGKQTLYLDVGSTADTTVASRIKEPASVRTQEVDCISLDELFARCGISRCNLMKVDVEGAEFEIFEAASLQTLAKIDAIAMEYHEHEDRRHHELSDLLKAHGYCVRVSEDRYPDLGMIYARRIAAGNCSNGSRGY
ncbi:MAG TPA: FkbM family methyltransferase [Blastocatellia bacterium]|jgi:FkbM family methyltransferase|nr:FkbM family methyltransferase [Blastocatellia bacterium]